MKISDKLSKINDSFTINLYHNGYMLEANGRSDDDEWGNAKIMCQSIDELLVLVNEAATMERDE